MPTTVAAVLGCSAAECMSWYRKGGPDAVRERRKGGVDKPSHLTKDLQAQLVAKATKGVFGTAQTVRDWIEARFGVD